MLLPIQKNSSTTQGWELSGWLSHCATSLCLSSPPSLEKASLAAGPGLSLVDGPAVERARAEDMGEKLLS